MSQSPSDSRPAASRSGLVAALLRRPARLVPAALGLLIVFAVAGTAIQGLAELEETRREGRDLAGRIETLEAEAAALRNTIERLENDPEALHLHAKAALGLVAPGETVALLQFPESVGPPPPRPPMSLTMPSATPPAPIVPTRPAEDGRGLADPGGR